MFVALHGSLLSVSLVCVHQRQAGGHTSVLCPLLRVLLISVNDVFYENNKPIGENNPSVAFVRSLSVLAVWLKQLTSCLLSGRGLLVPQLRPAARLLRGRGSDTGSNRSDVCVLRIS